MKEARKITLNDGTPGIVRPILPSDGEALASALEELGPESRIRRFFYDKSTLSEGELEKLTHPDGVEHIALGLAVDPSGEGQLTPIAVARCFRDRKERDLAEVAVVIADPWQGKGAGAELMGALSEAAREVGICRWYASILSYNTAMKHLLDRFGTMCEERDLGNGVLELIYDITRPPDEPADPGRAG